MDRRPLFLLLAFVLLAAAPRAAEPALFHAAPDPAGARDGSSPEAAAGIQDPALWQAIQQRLASGPVTLRLAAGNYLLKGETMSAAAAESVAAGRRPAPTVLLTLDKLGHPDHPLLIEGEGDGAIFRRSPDAATASLPRADLIFVEGCRNLTFRNIHFTGPEEIGYAVRVRGGSRDITFDRCSWVDLPNLTRGASGTSGEGTRDITWRNCTFRRVGKDSAAHMLYNAYAPTNLNVIDCVFEDCAGDYVRFRDRTDDCVVTGCTFTATGDFRNAGMPFITIPLFNDDDPTSAARTPRHEYFGTRFSIHGNTFSYPATPTEGERIAVYFYSRGFDPPGRHHLMTAADGEILTSGSIEARRALLRERTGIDTAQVHVFDNRTTRVDHEVAFGSWPAYGATSRGWEGLVAISDLVSRAPSSPR